MMATLAHYPCLAVEQTSSSPDEDVKDAWGLPALRVTFKNHRDDMKPVQFILERQKEILATAGARKLWVDPASIEEATYSRHIMGTCRMGDDARTSVVDRWYRAHDDPNLFLVDESSLVTSGRQHHITSMQ